MNLIIVFSSPQNLSTGDMIAGDDDYGKGFFTDLLRHIAQTQKPQDNKDEPFVTGRDLFNVSELLCKSVVIFNVNEN